MRFQRKVLLTYSLLILFLTVVLGFLFYRYSVGLFERNAAANYALLADRIGRQLDDLIRPMDFISANLISDGPFKSAIASLASIDRTKRENDAFLEEARLTIRKALMTYSIHKNFHAVLFFNTRGDFYSSNFMEHTATVTRISLADLPWREAAEERDGRPVVTSPYTDPWNEARSISVFSFARVISGLDDDMGYLEVQESYEELAKVFAVPEAEHVRVFVIQESGEIFFDSLVDRGPSLTPDLIHRYREMANGASGFNRNPVTGSRELVVSDHSAYTNLNVFMVVNRDLLLAPLAFTGSMTFITGMLIVLFSVTFNWVSSLGLTKSLRLITERMEETELANLPTGTHPEDVLDHPNDEIASLGRAFRGLTERLNEAIQKELSSRTAWMQAHLDSLQAQINPHFLYNVLTVIAARGLESGDEGIGDICDGIASMLRYSTGTAERQATLSDEIAHARTYLFLMQQRYEDRLSFSIEVEPAVSLTRVPKMILQQVVENSVNHGYRTVSKPMNIRIRCRRDGDNRWVAEISDDGQGIDAETMKVLDARFLSAAKEIAAGEGTEGLGIGGLGLVNTYTRLYLFYRGDLTWHIRSDGSSGTTVTLGAPICYKG